jgi:hypothetical protein
MVFRRLDSDPPTLVVEANSLGRRARVHSHQAVRTIGSDTSEGEQGSASRQSDNVSA